MADTLCGIHSSCPWLTAQLLVLVVVAVDVVDVIVVASHLWRKRGAGYAEIGLRHEGTASACKNRRLDAIARDARLNARVVLQVGWTQL